MKKKNTTNRVLYDTMTVWKEAAQQMIDGGGFGVSVCGRISYWLTWSPAMNAAIRLAARPRQLYFKEHALYM